MQFNDQYANSWQDKRQRSRTVIFVFHIQNEIKTQIVLFWIENVGPQTKHEMKVVTFHHSLYKNKYLTLQVMVGNRPREYILLFCHYNHEISSLCSLWNKEIYFVVLPCHLQSWNFVTLLENSHKMQNHKQQHHKNELHMTLKHTPPKKGIFPWMFCMFLTRQVVLSKRIRVSIKHSKISFFKNPAITIKKPKKNVWQPQKAVTRHRRS